jgi:hypothetical protein
MKKSIFITVALMLAFALVFTGCQKTEDTRQYIDTIGVVFTNEADSVINELFVFPSPDDGTDVFEQDMGPDMIKNTSSAKRVGSYGVTVEAADSYSVIARDRSRGIYHFGNVPLDNVSEAVLTFDGEKPMLSVYHRNGGAEAIEGEYVATGDAPDHTFVPLKKKASCRFTVKNDTGSDIDFISMLEKDNQDKGEVELYIGTLEAGSSVPVTGKLNEEDQEITEWVLRVDTADGGSTVSEESFDPWNTDNIDISLDGGKITFEAY